MEAQHCPAAETWLSMSTKPSRVGSWIRDSRGCMELRSIGVSVQWEWGDLRNSGVQLTPLRPCIRSEKPFILHILELFSVNLSIDYSVYICWTLILSVGLMAEKVLELFEIPHCDRIWQNKRNEAGKCKAFSWSDTKPAIMIGHWFSMSVYDINEASLGA